MIEAVQRFVPWCDALLSCLKCAAAACQLYEGAQLPAARSASMHCPPTGGHNQSVSCCRSPSDNSLANSYPPRAARPAGSACCRAAGGSTRRARRQQCPSCGLSGGEGASHTSTPLCQGTFALRRSRKPSGVCAAQPDSVIRNHSSIIETLIGWAGCKGSLDCFVRPKAVSIWLLSHKAVKGALAASRSAFVTKSSGQVTGTVPAVRLKGAHALRRAVPALPSIRST